MTKSLDASFEKLVDVIKALRDPESGCPWDLKQDLKSLRKYMIEEAFEAVDALGSEQVLFYILTHTTYRSIISYTEFN